VVGKRDYVTVKDVLYQGINEFGFFNSLGILFMVNFLGKALLDCMPKLSDRLMRIKVYFILNKKFTTI